MDQYGPQGWWPLYHSAPPPIYRPGNLSRPENDQQRFEIAVGAILTQNTAWSNVVLALTQLNSHNLLNLKSILDCEITQLSQLVRSAGYFNQKAQYLKNLAFFLNQNSFSSLQKLDGIEARMRLLTVKGIGEETADCILLYALGHPFFVIDAYTRRIMLQLGLPILRQKYSQIAQWYTEQLPVDVSLYQEFHGLLVKHGKEQYSKKPYPMLDPVLSPR